MEGIEGEREAKRNERVGMGRLGGKLFDQAEVYRAWRPECV